MENPTYEFKMRRFHFLAALFVVLFIVPQNANAIVFFGSLGTKSVGHKSYWPAGLKECAESHPRVGGDFMDAPTFFSGMMSVNLFYAGDIEKLNEMLRLLGKVKGEVVMVLDPRTDANGKNPIPSNKAKLAKDVRIDWQLTVITDGLIARGKEEFKDGPKTLVTLRYYLGERGHLMGLELPATLKLQSSAGKRYREAHPDDPTVDAVDSFIQLHNQRIERSKN